MSARRVETAEDWRLVWSALNDLKAIKRSKLIHEHMDPSIAYNALANMDEVWIADGYLTAFVVGSPWYSSRKILSELLIVRVEEGGTLRGVVHFLVEQARAAGADIVHLGTAYATSDRALSRLYQRLGFTPEATLLTMEI